MRIDGLMTVAALIIRPNTSSSPGHCSPILICSGRLDSSILSVLGLFLSAFPSHHLLLSVMSEKSLCFRSAGKALQDYPDAQGSISEEQWMWHIVQHMRGARHKLCTPLDPITNLADPVGHAISKIVLNNDYEPLKGKSCSCFVTDQPFI